MSSAAQFFARLFSSRARKEAQAQLEALRSRLPELKREAADLSSCYLEGACREVGPALEAVIAECDHPALDAQSTGFLQNARRTLERVQDDCALLCDGFPLPPPRPEPVYEPEERTILYVLQSCMPIHTNGYATRSHQILKAIRAKGWNAIGIARAGYPLNDSAWRKRIAAEGLEAVLRELPEPPAFTHDGVPYLYTPEPVYPHVVAKSVQIRATAEWIVRQAQALRPAVLHSASDFHNGLAAVLAGRELGIPVVYEIRGLWELTRAFERPGFEQTEQFALQAALEARTAREADAVFAITRGVAETLADRGVPSGRIALLPNAVDPATFAPAPRDPELESRYGLAGKIVIGFAGSLTAYEGLDRLLEAASAMPEALRRQVHLLIIGSGPHLEALQTQAAALRDRLEVTFTGRLPFEAMAPHYTLFDIAPLPRTRCPLTEMVSPLKPFELMAMGKALIVSDVRAQAEIVTHEATGLLHDADHIDALRAGLERLIGDSALRDRLGEAARQWVTTERSWSGMADRLSATYERLHR